MRKQRNWKNRYVMRKINHFSINGVETTLCGLASKSQNYNVVADARIVTCEHCLTIISRDILALIEKLTSKEEQAQSHKDRFG